MKKRIFDHITTECVGLICKAIHPQNDPLDGDEVALIGELFTLKLDIFQGNITVEEYRKARRKLMR
jgi:hypothetical protein